MRTLMKEFEYMEEKQYDQCWDQIDYLMSKVNSYFLLLYFCYCTFFQLATASSPHIRAQFCIFVSYLLKYSKECFEEVWNILRHSPIEAPP